MPTESGSLLPSALHHSDGTSLSPQVELRRMLGVLVGRPVLLAPLPLPWQDSRTIAPAALSAAESAEREAGGEP